MQSAALSRLEPGEQPLHYAIFVSEHVLVLVIQIISKLLKFVDAHPCAVDQHPIASQIAEFFRSALVECPVQM